MATSFITIGTVAKRLGVSTSAVRLYEKAGRVAPIRTETGLRLFTEDQVERLRKEREEREAVKVE